MPELDRNKAIARRFLNLVSAHDVDAMIELISPTWTMQGGPPNLPSGPAGLRALFATFGEVEQEWTIDAVVADGDLVVVRATNTCTQDSFFGVPSAGRQQVFTAMFMHRIRAGLIEETWRNADDLGRLLRLGAKILPTD